MSGSLSATASNALLLNGTGSVGFTTTGSFTTTSGSVSSRVSQIESVYATTGSNSFRATQSITGSLTVTGQIIAQTLNVQQVTSSIVFSSGSNTFGSDLNSRQSFTGSVIMTGSLTVNTTGTELQVNNNGVVLGNLLTDNHSVTGSLRVTGSATLNGDLTIGAAGQLYLTSGDLRYNSNAGFGIVTQNGERLVSIQNGAFGVTGAATFSSSITAGDLISTSYGIARILVTSTTNSQNSGFRLGAKDSAGNTKNAGLYYTAGTTTATTLLSLSADDNNLQLNVLANGNVGIGTSSPSQRLTLVGSSTLATFAVGTDTTHQLLIGADSSYSEIQAITQGVAFNKNLILQRQGGNVAIGGTDNGEKLNIIAGNIKLYSYQNSAGEYRYIGSEYSQGNGNNRAEVRFGIDSSDTRTFLSFATANGGGTLSEIARITATGELFVNTVSNISPGGFTYRLQVNGPAHMTELSLGDSYNRSVATDSSWSSFQTIIPGATLEVFAVYLITASYSVNNQPYNVTTSFTFVVPNCNGSGGDNEFTPICATHTGGTGTMSFRAVAASGQSAGGLQVKFNGFATLTGTLVLRATRLKRNIG